MNDALTTTPAASKEVLDQLFEGAKVAFSMGIAQTMLLLSGVLLVSILIIWFGMRKYQLEADAA